MRKQKKERSIGSSVGLIAPTSQVSTAPARAVTSHARHVFRNRYSGRYRFARLVFAFDAFLLAMLGSLLIFDLVILFRGLQTADPGLEVVLAAPELRTSDVVPIEVKVRVTDAKEHIGVRVFVRLPEEMTLLQAWPNIGSDGSWAVGKLSPGDEITQRLLVHLDATINTRVALGFTLEQYDPILFAQSLVGTDVRAVQSSALRIRALLPLGGVSQDAQIPVLIENRSMATSSPMNVILAESQGAPIASLGSDNVYSFPGLAANSQKIVFVNVGKKLESDRLRFVLYLQSAGRKVDQLELDMERVADLPAIVLATQIAETGDEVSIRYSSAQTGARLIVLEKETSAFRQVVFDALELAEGEGTVSVKRPGQPAAGQMALVARFDGEKYFLSGRAIELEPASLPFAVQARYYTASGDQLGLGPLPPVVGESTRYWILWTLGPFDRSLSDLEYEAQLAPNVRATGKFASTVPLDFSASEDKVKMTADEVKLAGAGNVVFGYEVELLPTENQRGFFADLVLNNMVSAIDEFGKPVESSVQSVDTGLMTDEKAIGKGVVE